jgi:hypothetical protein
MAAFFAQKAQLRPEDDYVMVVKAEAIVKKANT